MTSLPALHVEHRRPANPALRVLAQPARHVEGLDQHTENAGDKSKGGHAHGKGEYPVSHPNVLPSNFRLSQNALKLAISLDIQALQKAKYLSDEALGDAIGCCGQTISNARNMRNELTFFILLKLAAKFGEAAMARSFALINMRLVPVEATCDTDRRCGSAVSRLAYSISCALEDDEEIDDDELEEEVGPALEAAGTRIDALRERYRLRKIVKQLKAEQFA